jgi:C4-dicarboxylate-specific signal transduction histidine kinase
MAAYPSTGTADLQTVLDEAWIIMEPSFRDAEIEVIWNIADNLPRVRGDQQGLVQVLINLLRNSRVALENAETKKVYISAVENVSAPGRIQVRVRDTGPGIAHPAQIFHVFPSGAQTGLGLYVSRSIVLSFGGDLRHESDVAGASFVLDLGSAPPEETPSGET